MRLIAGSFQCFRDTIFDGHELFGGEPFHILQDHAFWLASHNELNTDRQKLPRGGPTIPIITSQRLAVRREGLASFFFWFSSTFATG